MNVPGTTTGAGTTVGPGTTRPGTTVGGWYGDGWTTAGTVAGGVATGVTVGYWPRLAAGTARPRPSPVINAITAHRRMALLQVMGDSRIVSRTQFGMTAR